MGNMGMSRRKPAIWMAVCLCSFQMVISVQAAEPVIITNQAIGMGVSWSDGSLYPMDLLAADRPTGMYVKLDEREEKENGWMSMRIEGEGRMQMLSAVDYDEDAGLLSFTREGIRLPAGEYTITVTAGGDQIVRTVEFYDMKQIRVLAVLIDGRFGQEVLAADTKGMNLESYTMQVYPLGDEDLEWSQYGSGSYDLTKPQYDLDTSTGRYRVWSSLKALQDEEHPYDLIVGLTAENMFPRAGSMERSITGFTFGEPVCVVSLKDTSPAVTVAHEIGHCYRLGDEYENGTLCLQSNMAPYGMKGKDRNDLTSVVQGTCPFIRGGAGDEKQGTGTLVAKRQYPYDVLTGELINRDMTSLMGLSGYEQKEYWTTPAIWETMFRALAE